MKAGWDKCYNQKIYRALWQNCIWVCRGRWATSHPKAVTEMTKYSKASFFSLIYAIFVIAYFYTHIHFNMEFILQLVKKSSEWRGTCHIFPPILGLHISCFLNWEEIWESYCMPPHNEEIFWALTIMESNPRLPHPCGYYDLGLLDPSYSACVHAKLLWLCPTLCHSMDGSPPGSSAHGILQARNRSGLPHASPGDLPDPGIKPAYLMLPVLAGGCFTTNVTWTWIVGTISLYCLASLTISSSSMVLFSWPV